MDESDPLKISAFARSTAVYQSCTKFPKFVLRSFCADNFAPLARGEG